MAGFYEQRVISFSGRCALNHCLSLSLNTELLPATWASRDDDLQDKKRGGEGKSREVKSNDIIPLGEIWYTCTSKREREDKMERERERGETGKGGRYKKPEEEVT